MADPAHQRTNWFAIFALFVAGLVASMHFAKVAPVMGQIGADLDMSLIAQGFAVSILGIVGVLFAISTGALVAAIGLARGMSIALFGGAALAVAGAFAPNATAFLAVRGLEGFSHLLIVVCAPVLMAHHASERDRPIALAIWGCFFGLGFAITSVAAPPIVTALGWRGLLASHALVLAMAGFLVADALARVGHQDKRTALPGAAALIEAHKAVYASGAPLLLALVFCAYTIQFLAVLTFLIRYLTEARHWSAADAGSLVGAVSLVTLVATLAAGFLVRHRVPLFGGLAVAFVMTAAAGAGVFGAPVPDSTLVPLILVMMTGFGLMPGFVFANVPSVAGTPERAPLAYGAMAQFGNVGTFAGTPVFAAAYQAMGWPGGAGFLVTMAAAGIGLAALLRRSMVLTAGRTTAI